VENEKLINKIDSISKIHENLLGKYEALKENHSYYERILIKNPGFLVNYRNVVDIMIKQTEKIELLKIENRALNEKIRENQFFKSKKSEIYEFNSNPKEISNQS
jgi:hypothetical protein